MRGNQTMTTTLDKFKQFALTRAESRQVTGGITCKFTVKSSGEGGGHSFGGACASSSMSVCFESARKHAVHLALTAGAGVDFSCQNYTAYEGQSLKSPSVIKSLSKFN
jgi:hypothetical protein